MDAVREEGRRKRELYDDQLSPREYVKAKKYSWYSMCCLAAAWAFAIIFIGIGTNSLYLEFLIIIGFIGCSISLGLSLIFHAKAVFIQKYIFSKFFSNSYYLFDAPAIKLAKFNLTIGYLFIILGIGFPLLTFILVQSL